MGSHLVTPPPVLLQVGCPVRHSVPHPTPRQQHQQHQEEQGMQAGRSSHPCPVLC
jgi:hypothetical protein